MTSSKVEPMTRRRPAEDTAERETLTGVLDSLRVTVVNKVAGLTDVQAFGAPVPPSTLTAASVVKHPAGVERFWFSIDFAAASDLPWPWMDDDPHGNFVLTQDDTLARIVGEDMKFTLRYALVHMIEETARHCGHLDLIRESIDGLTGQ